MAKATIFYDPPYVEATLLTGEKYNMPIYKKNINIFRGVDNTIEFSLKDSDRQAVLLLGRSIRCTIINPYNQQLMLSKYLYNKDEQAGRYDLRLTPGDIQEWSAGSYQYCLTLVGEYGQETVFYTTLDQQVTGVFNLIDAPFPEFVPSKLIKSEDWTMVNYNNIVHPYSTTFITSRFAGDAGKDYHDGLQTFSILLKNFTGNFYVQGSLEENPVQDSDWFNISVDPTTNADYQQFTNQTGINVFNFEGNYVWIRFKYIVYELANPRPHGHYNQHWHEEQYGKIEKIWLKI